MSVRQMVGQIIGVHHVDPQRVFVTGLSAGGAMTNVMLATYPEIFAGGAIIGGLAYGVASTVPEAFDRMRGNGMPSRDRLAEAVRKAAPTPSRWPTISIWHGTSDMTVVPSNADAVLAQWLGVLGLKEGTASDHSDGHRQMRVWKDSDGLPVLSVNMIPGMGHGTPLDASDGREAAAPFMLDVGISSTREIAYEWGLTPTFERRTDAVRELDVDIPSNPSRPSPHRPQGIKDVIENALRSAGLM